VGIKTILLAIGGFIVGAVLALLGRRRGTSDDVRREIGDHNERIREMSDYKRRAEDLEQRVDTDGERARREIEKNRELLELVRKRNAERDTP